jgi:hypothetical protein
MLNYQLFCLCMLAFMIALASVVARHYFAA